MRDTFDRPAAVCAVAEPSRAGVSRSPDRPLRLLPRNRSSEIQSRHVSLRASSSADIGRWSWSRIRLRRHEQQIKDIHSRYFLDVCSLGATVRRSDDRVGKAEGAPARWPDPSSSARPPAGPSGSGRGTAAASDPVGVETRRLHPRRSVTLRGEPAPGSPARAGGRKAYRDPPPASRSELLDSIRFHDFGSNRSKVMVI